MKPLTLRRVLWSCALLAALLLGIVLLALRLGAVPFSFGDLGQNLWWLVTGQPGKISTDFRLIMVDIRLPRILLGIVVGAALSVAGAGFQALLRNPLADPYVLGVSSGAAVGAILTTASDLNVLLAGEREAMHLGVDVTRVKLVVYISASLLTGLAVSVSGAIGYVGLLVPHVMRMFFGSDYRLLIPTSALGGAIAIVLADTLARTVIAPTELPVGAMTAMAGAPVFIYLLRRRLA